MVFVEVLHTKLNLPGSCSKHLRVIMLSKSGLNLALFSVLANQDYFKIPPVELFNKPRAAPETKPSSFSDNLHKSYYDNPPERRHCFPSFRCLH